MEKPFSLKVMEFEKELVSLINSSQLPAYALKIVLTNKFDELTQIEAEEIKKYNDFKESEVDSNVKQN